MPVRTVENRFQEAIADRVLKAEEAIAIAESAGRINNAEGDAIIKSLEAGLQYVSREDRATVLQLIGEVQRYKGHQNRVNEQRDRLEPGFERQEAARLQPGVATTTFAGTKLPEAVKTAVRDAFEAGAEPYDVMRLDHPEVADAGDRDDGSFLTIEGEYSPYAQEQDASDTLAWSHTEITPAKLKEDMETVTRHQVYTGAKEEANFFGGTNKVAQYKTVEGKGNGSTCTHYAPGVQHPGNGRWARGSNGAKWTHNLAVMSDGTFHLLPAMRRARGAGVILTNPSMARGQRMLFNGHMTIRNGVVTGIGMSGRLHKLAERGDHKFANPIPLLEAWGFEVSPNLRLRFEGRRATPDFDDKTIG